MTKGEFYCRGELQRKLGKKSTRIIWSVGEEKDTQRMNVWRQQCLLKGANNNPILKTMQAESRISFVPQALDAKASN